VSGAATATFVYDGDGNRVKGTVGGVTITYIGNYYEWSGSTATSYYYAGSLRVAMRQGSTLSYMFADHLGSTSVVANSSGSKTAEVRYKAWGEDRYTSGTVPSGYRYTGQRVEATLGLYFYGARWYDSSLGRFLSADSIVPNPGDPQAWDRYAYVDNNPVKFVDPSGHMLDPGGAGGSYDDLTFAEKWHVQNATMQSRIKNDYEDAGKLNSITDSLLSHEGPATGFLYFSWAVNNVIENLGQGSTALEQATIDLAIVGGSNLASRMMGLAAGGDVTPGVGSGNAYSVAYETTIPKTVFQYARSSHNYYANKALLADIKADPQFAQAMNELIPNLSQELYYRPNASPKGWTWHHVAKQPGVMQLIPRVQHESPLLQYLLHPGGRGGFSLWP
jgi:RHS repeat-associated protein